ncbi:deoxyribonuclease-1-like [Mytilus trossulus]|uniref:deoxyribonuclease-1-like n=1 Tax=Mytilus trossulus TaxID=6551 RepID=UPI0030060AAA
MQSKMFVQFFVLLSIYNGYQAASIPQVAKSPLTICAFNIQVFGVTKMDKPEVVDILIDILIFCDLTLIQEIRDASDTAFNELKAKANAQMSLLNKQLEEPCMLESVISEKLGRSSSKEQYGFLYWNCTKLRVTDTYQYDDPLDVFERPPFVVRFESLSTDVSDFAILALHSKPSKAPEEIDNITRVYDIVKSQWHLEDVIIAGDLNSDCSYLPDRDHDTVSLYNDPRFTWLIGDDVDTTTGNSECSYDRFVVAGSKLKDAVVPNSARVFKFDEYFNLTPEQTSAVSDHYPIEMQLAGKANMEVLSKVKDAKTVESMSKEPVGDIRTIRELYKNDIYDSSSSRTYDVLILKEGYSQYLIEAVLDHIEKDQLKTEIAHFQDMFPKLLTSEMEAVIIALVDSESFKLDYVYGINDNKQTSYYKFKISCLVETLKCTASVEKETI